MEYKIVTSNIFFSHLSEEIKLNQFASRVLNIITIHLNNEVKIKRKKAEFKKGKQESALNQKPFPLPPHRFILEKWIEVFLLDILKINFEVSRP